MSGRNPAAILYDANGNPVAITLDGAVYRLEAFSKLKNAAGSIINPASEDTLATIDGVLDAIKDTAGIKKITDALPVGSNEIGAVKQGTRAAGIDAWPVYLTDFADGDPVTITHDVSVNRLEIAGKVTIIGASPPPSTTGQIINADSPLVVGSHDTIFVIPPGEVFFLQNITAGNEDPTKGAVITLLYNNGTEHLVGRIFVNGITVSIGFSDVSIARDGTSLVGNGSHTLIVRREKFAGTNIAIDAVVTGYTV